MAVSSKLGAAILKAREPDDVLCNVTVGNLAVDERSEQGGT